MGVRAPESIGMKKNRKQAENGILDFIANKIK